MSRAKCAWRSRLVLRFGAMVAVGVAPWALAASRDLVVSSFGTGSVLRYDGVTRALLGAFVPPPLLCL